jgi:hypothetical protein
MVPSALPVPPTLMTVSADDVAGSAQPANSSVPITSSESQRLDFIFMSTPLGGCQCYRQGVWLDVNVL